MRDRLALQLLYHRIVDLIKVDLLFRPLGQVVPAPWNSLEAAKISALQDEESIFLIF